MVTSDFVCPSTTLHAVPGELDLRGSVRVWLFRQRQLLKTIQIPGAVGTIDVKLIPDDPRQLAYTAGMADDHLYLIDTNRGKAKAVFDFSTIATGGFPQLMRMTRDGKRLFVSMNAAGKIVMFDTSTRKSKSLKVLDLGAQSGPHYIALTENEKRLVITDYFLNEDDFGKVHAEGDHKIHVARVTPKISCSTRDSISTSTRPSRQAPRVRTGSRSNDHDTNPCPGHEDERAMKIMKIYNSFLIRCWLMCNVRSPTARSSRSSTSRRASVNERRALPSLRA